MQAEFSKNRKRGSFLSPTQKDSKKKTKVSHETSGTLKKFFYIVRSFFSDCLSYATASSLSLLKKLLSAVVAICCVISFLSFFTFGTGVYLGKLQIGVVQSEEQFRKALAAADTFSEKSGIESPDLKFTTATILTFKNSIISAETLKNRLLVSGGNFVYGYELRCNGEPVFSAESKKIAESAVNKYISSYAMNGDASVSQEITYVPRLIAKKDISTESECINILKQNDEISVVSVVNSTSSQEIPFETKTENDNTLFIGETLTVTKGKNGTEQISSETIYENGTPKDSRITDQKVIAEPVTQVVKVGTKPKHVLDSGLFYPLKGTLSSPFGSRWGRNHEGIDIAVPEGTSVKAAECGTVSYVSENAGGYGKFIKIDHGHGITTAYAHLSEILVTKGQTVNSNTVIARSGNTGRSTGPHLHFEIIENGNPIDPLPHLSYASAD